MGPCPATAGSPRILFPQDKPNEPTGPGAIAWAPAGTCGGGAGARVDRVLPAQAPDAPALPLSRSGAALAPIGPLAAAAGPHGQIVLAGDDPHHPERALIVQGRAGGAFKVLLDGGPPPAAESFSTAYLGDVAFATPSPASGATVSIERWFATALDPIFPATRTAVASGRPRALTVAMDFRSDALLAWAQGGSVWARDLPAKGLPRTPQRLGPAGSEPHIAALLSDDNRGMVMWSDRRGSTTETYLDYSAAGPRFGRPSLLERDADPIGIVSPPSSPLLIRLSSESVMTAWAGVEGSDWVIRTAPIDQRGLQTVSTIAAPSGDALLSALAPGPRGEAVVLFTEPVVGSDGEPSASSETLWAARGIDVAPGRTQFALPEQVAPAGPVAGATVAVEPGSDRALAAWRGEGGRIVYSLRTPDPTP
ncbi:MAG TPA: hypothetical protein VH061_05110 [Solirubrobacteraceae bacterium]|nr:hypothetical protein [Solirubrobacteraceae bacterium]